MDVSTDPESRARSHSEPTLKNQIKLSNSNVYFILAGGVGGYRVPGGRRRSWLFEVTKVNAMNAKDQVTKEI